MRQANKERMPEGQSRTVDNAADTATAGTAAPAEPKPHWIEHRDWRGEGVVGDSHTD